MRAVDRPNTLIIGGMFALGVRYLDLDNRVGFLYSGGFVWDCDMWKNRKNKIKTYNDFRR